MELAEVVGAQLAVYGIVVSFVVILAALVFVFGFKTAEEPPFDKLTNSGDDRKPAGKKRKVKDKKSQSNGHVTTGTNEKSDSKQKSNDVKTSTPKAGGKTVDKRDADKVVKESAKSGAKQDKKQQKSEIVVKPALKENKNNKENKNENKQQKKQEQVSQDGKKQVNKNKGKENVAVEVKNKKNSAKIKKIEEKPADFDEGEWEQASYRKDRKKNRVLNAEDDNAGGDKKDASSPGKKKNNKATANNAAAAVTTTTTTTTTTAAAVEIIESETEKKSVKKDANKKEKKSPPQAEEVGDTADNKSDKNAAKKNKKKGGKDDAENSAPLEKDEVAVVVKIAEVAATQKVAVVPDPVSKMEENIAFDELADSCPEKWKEPKTSKKSNNRKKVRKDQ